MPSEAMRWILWYADHPLLFSISCCIQFCCISRPCCNQIKHSHCYWLVKRVKNCEKVSPTANSLSLGEIAEVLLKAADFFWFQQNLHQIPVFTEEHPLVLLDATAGRLLPHECGKWYHGATGHRKIHQEYIPEFSSIFYEISAKPVSWITHFPASSGVSNPSYWIHWILPSGELT